MDKNLIDVYHKLGRYAGMHVGGLAVLLIGTGTVHAATFTAKSPAFADVAAAIASASDGDTVVIPAGAASWTATLAINKGITLQGATTVTGDHNTALNGTPMAANDQTIITNNVPKDPSGNNRIMTVSLAPNQSFRLTGLTIRSGTTGASNGGAISINGTCPNVRVDHCHTAISGQSIHFYGWCYGVVDHCIFDFTGQGQMYAGMGGYGGGQSTQGDGSWADGPNFGTNKFIFFEDNTFNNNDNLPATGTIDATPGGRYVQRYNVLNGTLLSGGHGTENIERGVRAREIYGNIIYPRSATSGGNWGHMMRSGTLISYNNTWVTTNANLVGGKSLQIFRDFWTYTPWGTASGANSWDINDSEGNGKYVADHNPYLYDHGSHTGAAGATSLTDSAKNWTPNQWVNYTLINTRTNQPGVITGNTNNAITYYLYNDQGAPLKFNNGDGYQIHRLVVPMDGIGRGKGDLIQRINGQPQNTVTGTVSWPHNALEPCYCWDVYGGQPVKIHSGVGQGTTAAENREYYNWNNAWKPGNPLTSGVGVGLLSDRPTHCTPGTDIITGSAAPGVGYWATDTQTLYVCTASDTWTQYYTPYTYPHPLVSGKPAAPQNLRVTGP